MSLLDLIRSKLAGEPPVHPVELRMAKRWVKERLKRMYPELRDDPKRLEEVYQSLSLEPSEGGGKGGGAIYEMNIPGRLDD